MTKIHARAAERSRRDRLADSQKNIDKTKAPPPNFHVEDYVLEAEHSINGTYMAQVKWKGMRRVASVELNYVLAAENSLTKELKGAHATR
jgi:hypothetical protein